VNYINNTLNVGAQSFIPNILSICEFAYVTKNLERAQNRNN